MASFAAAAAGPLPGDVRYCKLLPPNGEPKVTVAVVVAIDKDGVTIAAPGVLTVDRNGGWAADADGSHNIADLAVSFHRVEAEALHEHPSDHWREICRFSPDPQKLPTLKAIRKLL